MATVLLKNLNKHYDGTHAVKDVNLEIHDHEFVVLVGPSGCGKTTTLRMVAGLEDITSGDVSIDGKVVNNLAPMDRDIAMVFQNYALYPHMSVYDNMAFGLRMRKFEKPEIDRRVKQAADVLGIHALLERRPRQLSGGQRVRVPPARTEALRQHVEKNLILGLRPETLHPQSASDDAHYAFEAMVEVVEPLGSEILLDTRVGEVPVVARVEPSVRVSAHE